MARTVSSIFNSDHPRFLAKLALFVAIQAILFVAIASRWYWPGAPHLGITRDKHRLLRESPSPRMIFVCGSNLLFGMDSPTIYRETGYHPINMGLVGALRLDYYLREIENSVRSGDIVVLALEYQQLFARFSDSDVTRALLLAQLIEQRPANALHLGYEHWRVLLDRAALPYLGLIVRTAADGMRPQGNAAASLGERMARWKTNRYGDLVSHRGRSSTPQIKPIGLGHVITPESLRPQIDRLNEFHRLCERRGAKVVYSYPPVPQGFYPRSTRLLGLIEAEFREHLKIPVIHSPQDMLFPLDRFYNTAYHLLGEGPRERAERLVEALRPYLEPQPSPIVWHPGFRFEPEVEQADLYLVKGWWPSQGGAAVRVGEPARLRFDLEEVGPYRLALKMRVPRRAKQAFELEVAVNGHSLGTKVMKPGRWLQARFRVRPKHLLRRNSLTLDVRPVHEALGGAQETRILLDRVDFELRRRKSSRSHASAN